MGSGLNIFIAEDDDQYAFIMQLALLRSGNEHHVDTVNTSAGTLNYLKALSGHGRPMPDLIIIGLRLPMLHDFEVLRWIRGRRSFDTVPVAILAGTEYPGEGPAACQLGADLYIVKPSDFGELVDLMRQLCSQPVHCRAKAAA